MTGRCERAFALAVELHSGQTRTGTDVSYLAHLLGVTALVLEQGGGETEASAALLHDAVEDQGGTPTLVRIRGEVGDDVARIVEALTDGPEDSWRARKQAYVARLEDERADVLSVSLADKLDNSRATAASSATRCGSAPGRTATGSCGTSARSWTCSRRRAPGPAVEELAREVKALTDSFDSAA